MYGELMWKPWELKRATWAEVMLALHGLRDKDYWNEQIFRRVAAAVASAGNNAKFAQGFTRFWPDAKKRVSKVSDRQRKQLEHLKHLEQLRRVTLNETKQKLIDGRGA